MMEILQQAHSPGLPGQEVSVHLEWILAVQHHVFPLVPQAWEVRRLQHSSPYVSPLALALHGLTPVFLIIFLTHHIHVVPYLPFLLLG